MLFIIKDLNKKKYIINKNKENEYLYIHDVPRKMHNNVSQTVAKTWKRQFNQKEEKARKSSTPK
jgi:hypothetical protein